jgi:hypothetical protein
LNDVAGSENWDVFRRRVDIVGIPYVYKVMRECVSMYAVDIGLDGLDPGLRGIERIGVT